jgi:hypothetical protein
MKLYRVLFLLISIFLQQSCFANDERPATPVAERLAVQQLSSIEEKRKAVIAAYPASAQNMPDIPRFAGYQNSTNYNPETDGSPYDSV